MVDIHTDCKQRVQYWEEEAHALRAELAAAHEREEKIRNTIEWALAELRKPASGRSDVNPRLEAIELLEDALAAEATPADPVRDAEQAVIVAAEEYTAITAKKIIYSVFGNGDMRTVERRTLQSAQGKAMLKIGAAIDALHDARKAATK